MYSGYLVIRSLLAAFYFRRFVIVDFRTDIPDAEVQASQDKQQADNDDEDRYYLPDPVPELNADHIARYRQHGHGRNGAQPEDHHIQYTIGNFTAYNGSGKSDINQAAGQKPIQDSYGEQGRIRPDGKHPAEFTLHF